MKIRRVRDYLRQKMLNCAGTKRIVHTHLWQKIFSVKSPETRQLFINFEHIIVYKNPDDENNLLIALIVVCRKWFKQ